MRPALRSLLIAALFAAFLHDPEAPGQTSSPAKPGVPVLSASTRLVLVDVVVKDRSGLAVQNLPRNAFRLTEDRVPQTLQSFESAHPP